MGTVATKERTTVRQANGESTNEELLQRIMHLENELENKRVYLASNLEDFERDELKTIGRNLGLQFAENIKTDQLIEKIKLAQLQAMPLGEEEIVETNGSAIVEKGKSAMSWLWDEVKITRPYGGWKRGIKHGLVGAGISHGVGIAAARNTDTGARVVQRVYFGPDSV